MDKIIIGKINSKVGFRFKDSKTGATTFNVLWQPTAQPLQLIGVINTKGKEIDNYGCCAVKNLNGIAEDITINNISPLSNTSSVTSAHFTLQPGQKSDWYVLRRTQVGSVITTPNYVIADSRIKGRSGYIDSLDASFAYVSTISSDKGISIYKVTNKLLVGEFWDNYTLPAPLSSIGCGKLDTNVMQDFAIPSNKFTDSWSWPVGSKSSNYGTMAAIDSKFTELDSKTMWLSARTTATASGQVGVHYYDSLRCYVLPLRGITGRSRGVGTKCPFTYALDSDPSKNYPLYWGENLLSSSNNGTFTSSGWSTQYRIFYTKPAVSAATDPRCALMIEDKNNTWTFAVAI